MISPLKFSIASRIRDRYVLKFLRPQKNDMILDLGSGIGYFSELLYAYASRVKGMDLEPENVRTAKELYPDIDFLAADAVSLPFKDASFNKILCTEVLEHIQNDTSAIQELSRVLKPGGFALITVPCTQGIFGSSIKRIAHDSQANSERHFREGYSLASLAKLCKDNGMELLGYRYSMTFAIELYMGLTKLVFLALKKKTLNRQSELRATRQTFAMKLNALFLVPLLKFSILEDLFLSPLIKGHMLVALLTKRTQ
jgi:ubiquinone/menaquinone biosynthesis C-methylase UbiE